MRLDHRIVIEASPDHVWAFLMDLPAAASCVPGVERLDAGLDATYKGRLNVALGPVRLAFDGSAKVTERDDVARTAVLRLDGADRKLGGTVHCSVNIALQPSGEIHLETDLSLGGRLGDFGQPLIRRKADQILREFAENARRRLNDG